jgi:hypothetical protein
LGVSVGSCGGGGNSNNGGAEATGLLEGGVPANPLGVVGGQILNVAGDAPLANVIVTLISAGVPLSGKTDMNGLWSIGNVPAGSFILTTSLDGFEPALVVGTLPGAQGVSIVGNPVQTVPPIGLFQTKGTFAVRIVDQNGVAVPNVKVTARPQVRYFDYSNASPTPRGTYEVTASSGNDGLVNLNGLPDYAAFGNLGGTLGPLPIDVRPILVTGSQVYSFLGGTFTFNLDAVSSTGFIDQAVIRLAGPQSDLTILDSNIQYLRGQDASQARVFGAVGSILPPSGPITIAFNQSISANSVRAQLLNEDGTQASVLLTPTVTMNQLSLAPASPLTAGARYNLALHADALALTGTGGANREVNVTAPFFVEAGVTPKLAATPPKLSADKNSFVVQFSEPIGIGNASTAAVSCVVYYEAVNLDGDANITYPGEYSASALACPNPSLDITAMTPLENTAAGMPVTGFSSRWQVTFDNAGNGACKPGVLKAPVGPCVVPASGTAVHFVFGRTVGTATVKRADGTPVSDSAQLIAVIPTP